MSERFTLEKYQKIIDLLTKSEKTFVDIAKETNSSSSYIKRINDGRVKLVRFIFQDVVFPIRESKEQRNKKIMNDLTNGMSVKDAAKKYKMADSSICMITYKNTKNKK